MTEGTSAKAAAGAEDAVGVAAVPAEGVAAKQTQEAGESGEGLAVETVDLSDWIFQEGGIKTWPEEPVAMFALDGDETPRAAADVEGAKAAILAAMESWASTVDISSYNIPENQLKGFYKDLVNNHPGLFYVEGGYSACTSGGMVSTIELQYNRIKYTAADVPRYQAALEAAYNEAIPDAANMTDVQKARALHDYLVQHVEYDFTYSNYDAYTALVDGKTVCQGYSLAYAALLQKAEISFNYCTSEAMNHMWNTVQIGGAWYHVDTTWDDPTPDRIGHVRHKYFLNSDTQMGSEGTGQGAHHDWTSPTPCGSNTYDNAYWKNWDGKNPLSAIFYVDGYEYYLLPDADSAKVSMMCRNGDTATKVFEEPATWLQEGKGTYSLGDFSRLSYYNGKLYFNTPDKIYVWKPGSGGSTVREIYTHSEGGLIYASFVCDDKINMAIKPDPNSEETQKKVIDLPALSTGTIDNKADGGYPTSYTYNKSAIAAPTAAQFDTTNTGVTMTFEWYKGSVAPGNKLASAPAAAGEYTLRVKVPVTDTHQAAMRDFSVTIAKKAVTVSVSAADKPYDGDTTAQITANLESGVIAGDAVSLGTVTGTFADKNAGDGKTVTLAGGGLTGADAENYVIDPAMPASVTAAVTKRPVTVTADDKQMTYGGTAPALTYTIDAATPLVGAETLTGALQRAAGENAGSYEITQGTLTDVGNPNYAITFTNGTFRIHPVAYRISAMSSQSIYQGVGTFAQPEAVLAQGGQKVAGSFRYTYNSQDYDYNALVAVLDDLAKDATGTVSYTFTPDNAGNYTGTQTGSFTFAVKDVAFHVGGSAVTQTNAVTLKNSPIYGDNWADIVRKKTLTAEAAGQVDLVQSHFTLDVSGVPDAGTQTYQVLYNGTLNGKTYTNVVVCSGTVDVQKKPLTVTAGECKVSKTYDGTTAAGTVSGALTVIGILSGDSGAVKVKAAAPAYDSPSVHKQNVEAALSLEGERSGNYVLAVNKIAIPGEILPKPITPALAVTGTYSYTGQAIVPVCTVKDSAVDLAGTDYTLEYLDNINAGIGKVRITAKVGGNYSWSGAVEQAFPIAKADYSGAKTGSIFAVYGSEAEYSLMECLPDGYVLGTISVSDGDAILQGTPAAAGGKLSVKLADDASKADKSATVTIPVTGTANYNPYDIVITITMSSKANQSDFQFAQSAVTKVYGGGDFTVAASGAVTGSTVTYASSNTNVASVDASSGKVRILAAGSAVITADASGTTGHNAARASYALTVSPKALGWDISGLDAADEKNSIQDRKATLHGALKLTGILEADKSAVAFSCGAERLAGTYAAVTPGTQTVTIAWAGAGQVVLTGEKAGNYTIPATLPQISGRITEADNLPVASKSEDGKDYGLKREAGISKVPVGLTAEEKNLDTPSAVEQFVREKVMQKPSGSTGISTGNIAVYDVVLQIRTDDGRSWKPVSVGDFPKDGLTITIPYPAGTGAGTHDFVVVHLFTEDVNGRTAGTVEYPAVTKAEGGLTFKVNGLSPISVGWKELPAPPAPPAAPSGGTDDNGDDGDDDDAYDSNAQGNTSSVNVTAPAVQPGSAAVIGNAVKPWNVAKPGNTAKPGSAADMESTKNTADSSKDSSQGSGADKAEDKSKDPSKDKSKDKAEDKEVIVPATSTEEDGEFPTARYVILFGLLAVAVAAFIGVCIIKTRKLE